ncbi:MAG: WD40 repeat domain-containing protein [Chitinophagales bacterium]|nr:WD40 repeat domain-containing protein [Chitinophagales bacterium]
MSKILPSTMRNLFLLFALLSGSLLSAQVYTQNEAPVQQMKMPSDCYTTNLDKGNAALRRGNAKEALQYFKAARSCDEVQSNSRRLAELDSRILRTEEQLGIRHETNKVAEAVQTPVVQGNVGRKYFNELPPTRKNYRANPNLLKDTLDDCFQRMTDEADRAFRLRFWEDAASLYRAAKNCADADQAGRQLMSEKIVLCRNAAENELFAKQQEAERQARHAIAANLADDAQELLEKSDRSLAFRLADFANQYVAPDDNPDCVQAIFDAWYYQPSDQGMHKSEELFNPVFCYEIADYYGNKVQLKYHQTRNGKTQIWTFIPENGEINVREMPEMQTVQTIFTGEDATYYAFDVSAASDVLLVSKGFMEIHRGGRQHRVSVPNVRNWCFSPRGDELAFEDAKELKIYLLPVNQVFNQMASRKGAKSANIMVQPVEPREMVSGIAPGLLDLKYFEGKFWLGYSDRLEILSKTEPGKPWKKETIWHSNVNLPESFEQNHLNLELYPEEGFALLAYFNQSWIIPVNKASDTPGNEGVVGRYYQNLVPLAVSPDTYQMFCKDTLSQHDGIWILDVKTGDTITHQHLPTYASYQSLKGSYSPDGAWIAAATEGSINIWSLREAPTKSNMILPVVPEDKPLITPDGSMLVIQQEDNISVLSLPDLENKHNWKSLGTPLRGISSHWALIQVSSDSAEARHLTQDKKIRLPLFNPDAFPYLYSFDANGEKWVAYNTAWDQVEVRSLQTGALVASRKFEGGNISELHFIPGRDQLLVVLNAETGYSSVKIWSPLEPSRALRTMRLHLYSVNTLAIEPNGRRIALSDENDIRIFDLQNIENEALKIRSSKSRFINNLAFRPNTDLLAAAYADGNVIFWNVTNGQPALQLQAVEQQAEWNGSTAPTALGFAQDGNELILAIANGHILTYVLDPSYIRAVVQNEYRQLQSLTLDQIQEYNLESALYYPGNFERLATSNDGPLIRAFFQHFGNQALGSNNIDQVRDYCDKALFLYERLNAKIQARWVNEMVYMYKDYAWKLLLRGNIRESTAVVNFIKNKFKQEAVLQMAHTALLQDDCQNSGKYYTQHFLGDGSRLQDNYEIRVEMEQAERELIQLRDFGLVDSAQLDCFCGAMRLSGGFVNLCPTESNKPNSLNESDMLRWEIFKKTQEAVYTFAFAPKQKLLEEAVGKARKLSSLRPELGSGWLESTVLELAKTFHERANLEQNSPGAYQYFEACRRLLTENGSFKSVLDTSRLALLATNHLACGRQLLNAGKYMEAVEQFNGGIAAMNTLWPIVYAADSMLITGYSDNLVGPLYERLGTAFLFQGDTTEARMAYEKAGIYMITNGLNTLYMGGLNLLQGDDIEALANYGGIFNANQTGEAYFMMEQLSRLFPAKRESISNLRQQLFTALQTKNPRLVNAEADYWYAVRMQLQFAAQTRWDSTLLWSRQMQKAAKACMDMPKSDESWIYNWLDAQISVAYYLLLAEWNKAGSLNEVIQVSNNIENFLKEHTDLYYGNRELVKTNSAHALILRNQPGDRETGIQLYQKFMQSFGNSRGYDNIDLLEKDIRDLKSVGAPWPELPSFQQILDNQR